MGKPLENLAKNYELVGNVNKRERWREERGEKSECDDESECDDNRESE